MTDRKRMSIKEFRDLGFLQEANRLFFHPHGLALEVRVLSEDDRWDDPEPTGWRAEMLHKVEEALRLSGEAPGRPILDPRSVRDGEDFVDHDALRRAAIVVLRALYPEGSQHLSGVWDCRDDPEGVVFGDLGEGGGSKADLVLEERRGHYDARCDLFGVPPDIRRAVRDADVEPLGWVYRARVEGARAEYDRTTDHAEGKP